MPEQGSSSSNRGDLSSSTMTAAGEEEINVHEVLVESSLSLSSSSKRQQLLVVDESTSTEDIIIISSDHHQSIITTPVAEPDSSSSSSKNNETTKKNNITAAAAAAAANGSCAKDDEDDDKSSAPHAESSLITKSAKHADEERNKPEKENDVDAVLEVAGEERENKNIISTSAAVTEKVVNEEEEEESSSSSSLTPRDDAENNIKKSEKQASEPTPVDETAPAMMGEEKNPERRNDTPVPPVSSKAVPAGAPTPSSETPVGASSSSTSTSDDNNKRDKKSALLLAALPLDSMHHVASFLTIPEWSQFGKTCTAARRVHKEVIRRVCLHGFKCATEVVTAWKLHQQHADAKELVALYIRAGVPIYPASLGHSYHTLVWRMQVETKEMMNNNAANTEALRNNTPTNNNDDAVETSATISAPEANEPHQEPPLQPPPLSGSTASANVTRTSATPAPGVDPFYSDRLEFRAAQGFTTPDCLTYLEEKCLYWMDHEAAAAAAAAAQEDETSASVVPGSSNPSTPTRRASSAGSTRLSLALPPPAVAEYRTVILAETMDTTPNSSNRDEGGAIHPPIHPNNNNNNNAPPAQSSPSRLSSSPHRGAGGDLSPSYHGHARMPLMIHKHLLQQHKIGMYSVDDKDGTMVTPPISLSADFYHAHAPQRPFYTAAGATAASQGLVDERQQDENGGAAVATSTTTESTNRPGVSIIPEVGPPTYQQQQQQQEPAVVANDNVENNLDRAVLPDDVDDDDQNPEDLTDEEEPRAPRPPPSPMRVAAVSNYCDIDAYTAGSLSGNDNSNKTTTTDSTAANSNCGSRELKRHLRSRFATYQRRLNAFLTRSDNSGFEECMLDFWDEFFPHTANIQYYDRRTPVPRISCLPKFLTKPCPKAIGIVQCEIERIKITTKGKGVSMKGRLFPTYEYRLFIRNQPHTTEQQENGTDEEEDDSFTRRDTVLMVGKHRGRKHVEVTGVAPSKKGANNYYLYMPQQADVDAHFNKVNDLDELAKMTSNGASHEPVLISDDASSVLMGRLQSNFIGTEFQIFTPTVRKQRRRHHDPTAPRTVLSPSDDELDYDSGVSSDNNCSSRRSRFGRFLRSHGDASLASLDTPRTRARSEPRRASSPDLGYRPTRTNRRAIANSEHQVPQPPVMAEEEDGAITYTANLLGSRPRIMDVCIPKVAADGVAGEEWKKFIETCEDHDDCRMLNCFKTLQQRLENLDPQQPRQPGEPDAQRPEDRPDADNNNNATGGDDHGLLALQNRPPWWNVELGSFVLNFGGRVSVASVKNFQLCDRNDQDNIMLQFGRIQGRHSFTMDFQHPLTAVQAFSIAISSLQSKISFG